MIEQHPRRVVVIAGPNGSGKSALTEQLRTGSALGFPFPAAYINADEIAAQLRTQNDPDPERTAFHHGRDLRRSFREGAVSFAYETVLSHPSGLLDLQWLALADYHVTLVAVLTANPEINVARVAGRVLAGGHHVPEDRIRSRYSRCLAFLPCAVERAHDAWIFDSTDRIRLCVRFRNGFPIAEAQPPDYIQSSILNVLRQRLLDRTTLRSQVEEGAAITLPDEFQGRYEGEVAVGLSTAFLQRVGPGRYIQHDAALAVRQPSPGEQLLLQYKQGYAVEEG